jgi:uncharacterized protein (DUF1786 family)
MGRFLLIDIGAGTMDILCYDTDTGRHSKAVAISPIRQTAEAIARTNRPLVFSGGEMGGGAVSAAISEKAATTGVRMTRRAADTVHHDPQRIARLGIDILSEEAVTALAADGSADHFRLADIQPDRLRQVIEGLGEPFAFDAIAVCAQDHGRPPRGVSHLDFRHRIHRRRLDAWPQPEACLFHSTDIPSELNRLRTIAADAQKLPAGEIYVMDSGMAAILGASLDPSVSRDAVRMVLDVATSHTVAAIVENNDIAAFFEYHTHDISREALEGLLPDLAEGRLTHEQVLSQGGHGAYLRRKIGFDRVASVVATGPKRQLLVGSRLPVVWGAPLGDNMMTGTVGLLAAVCRRLGQAEAVYV